MVIRQLDKYFVFQEQYSLKRKKSQSVAILIETENEVKTQGSSGKVNVSNNS